MNIKRIFVSGLLLTSLATSTIIMPASVDAAQKTYKVQRGDYLNKISKKYGVSVANIKKWNNLKSDVIRVNQTLKVSAPASSQPKPQAKPSTPAKTTQTNQTTYTVQRGDYLNKIATKYKVSVANIKSWNNLNSNTIYVGQKLKVSAPKTAVKPVAQPAPKPVAKPAPKPVAKPVVKATSHKVVKGDTLSKIGSKYGVSVANLKLWNGLKNDTIRIGQTLTLKKPAPKPAPAKPTTPSTGNKTPAPVTKKLTVQDVKNTLSGLNTSFAGMLGGFDVLDKGDTIKVMYNFDMYQGNISNHEALYDQVLSRLKGKGYKYTTNYYAEGATFVINK